MENKVTITENYLFIGADLANSKAYLKYYLNRNNIIVAEGTKVFPPYEGQGLGFLLFQTLITIADEKKAKIMTYCSYVTHQLNKSEYKKYRA